MSFNLETFDSEIYKRIDIWKKVSTETLIEAFDKTPTLFIGLGGAGGAPVARIWQVLDEMRSLDNAVLRSILDTKSVLILDSVSSDAFSQDPSYKGLRFDNTADYTYLGFQKQDIAALRKDYKDILDERVDLPAVSGAGLAQFRQLGYLSYLVRKNEVLKKIRERVNTITNGQIAANLGLPDGFKALNVVVATGSCGGTGSGAVIGLLSDLLEEIVKNNSKAKITAVFPDPKIYGEMGQFILSNGYAFIDDMKRLKKGYGLDSFRSIMVGESAKEGVSHLDPTEYIQFAASYLWGLFVGQNDILNRLINKATAGARGDEFIIAPSMKQVCYPSKSRVKHLLYRHAHEAVKEQVSGTTSDVAVDEVIKKLTDQFKNAVASVTARGTNYLNALIRNEEATYGDDYLSILSNIETRVPVSKDADISATGIDAGAMNSDLARVMDAFKQGILRTLSEEGDSGKFFVDGVGTVLDRLLGAMEAALAPKFGAVAYSDAKETIKNNNGWLKRLLRKPERQASYDSAKRQLMNQGEGVVLRFILLHASPFADFAAWCNQTRDRFDLRKAEVGSLLMLLKKHIDENRRFLEEDLPSDITMYVDYFKGGSDMDPGVISDIRRGVFKYVMSGTDDTGLMKEIVAKAGAFEDYLVPVDIAGGGAKKLLGDVEKTVVFGSYSSNAAAVEYADVRPDPANPDVPRVYYSDPRIVRKIGVAGPLGALDIHSVQELERDYRTFMDMFNSQIVRTGTTTLRNPNIRRDQYASPVALQTERLDYYVWEMEQRNAIISYLIRCCGADLRERIEVDAVLDASGDRFMVFDITYREKKVKQVDVKSFNARNKYQAYIAEDLINIWSDLRTLFEIFTGVAENSPAIRKNALEKTGAKLSVATEKLKADLKWNRPDLPRLDTLEVLVEQVAEDPLKKPDRETILRNYFDYVFTFAADTVLRYQEHAKGDIDVDKLDHYISYFYADRLALRQSR